MTATKIITAYTTGELTLEEANRRLADAGAGFALDPGHRKLTPEMEAEGYCYLDTGTGSLDVVQVKNGRLVDNDMGEMPALVLLNGEWHEVRGREVVEE